jgi:hypothetical protein
MTGGKVFDYQIREIFGEAIASSEVAGNEIILRHDKFACVKASLRHIKGRIVATDFMLFISAAGVVDGGWWVAHGTVIIRMMAMGAKVPPNIAGIFWSIGLWWEIGLAHALPEAAKALEPRPFVFETARNEVVGVGAADIRELAGGPFAHTISPGSQDDALHVGAKT